MDDDNSHDLTSTHHLSPTNLTFITTGLVTSCNLISNDSLKKICISFCPIVAFGAIWAFKKLKNYSYHRVILNRAVKTYTTLILECNTKLDKPDLSDMERKRIIKQIEKYEDDLNSVKIKSIKVFI